jgi:hypothetical protein
MPTKRKPLAQAKHLLPQQLIEAVNDAPPPIALSGERLELLTTVKKKWRLSIADEALLKNGCEALERAARLAAVVEQDGGSGVVTDRFGCRKPHPALQGERDFRGLAARILQQLTTRLDGGAG